MRKTPEQLVKDKCPDAHVVDDGESVCIYRRCAKSGNTDYLNGAISSGSDSYDAWRNAVHKLRLITPEMDAVY